MRKLLVVVCLIFELLELLLELRLSSWLRLQGCVLFSDLMKRLQGGVLVGLREIDVESNHPGLSFSQEIHQLGKIAAGEGPASEQVLAFLIDGHDHNGRTGLLGASKTKAQIEGSKFDFGQQSKQGS